MVFVYVFIGPPGIGKTSSAVLACRSLGIEPIEMNASDTRNRAALQDHVQSLITSRTINQGKIAKTCLIMDEVDGMSAGDRGGAAELAQLIKKTRIPIICICNEAQSQKVRSLRNICYDLPFRRYFAIFSWTN